MSATGINRIRDILEKINGMWNTQTPPPPPPSLIGPWDWRVCSFRKTLSP